MAEMPRSNLDALLVHRTSVPRTITEVHPAWLRLMSYCTELRHGEIEKLKIQDGLPMVAEVTTRKIRFSP